MDQTQLQQNIAKYYTKLPLELQQFFSSMKWMDDLKNICTKYSFKDEQISTLGTETTLLLLGIIHTDEYKNTLINDLGLSDDISNKVFDEIDTLILKDNSEKIEEAFSINVDSLLEEKYGGDKKLDERFASLPKEVQVAINESDYQTTLYAIASKYKLSVEQMGILEEITTKVMLNIIHPDQYENELISKITISKDDISNLVKDVNEQILKTIREVLKKHWDENNIKEKVVSSMEDQVPLPPYMVSSKEQVLSSIPHTVNTKQEEVALVQDSVNEIIKKIEPIKIIPEKPKNIIEEKLKGVTAGNIVVSDYSLPQTNKIPPTSEKPKASDPYREVF